MNYSLHYDNLINNAKERTLEGYKESHHVIPRCLGGTDDKDNLVNLTAREHFIAHLLLWKLNPTHYGLVKAISIMCVQSPNMNENRSCNRMYGWLREKFSEAQSFSQSGEGNSQFGTMWIHNLDLKESKKIPKSDEIPLGWNKGRKINFDLDNIKQELKDENKEINKNNAQKKIQEKRNSFLDIFEAYKTHGYKYVVENFDYDKSEGALYSKLKTLFGEFKKQYEEKIDRFYICQECSITFMKKGKLSDNFKCCSRKCSGLFNKPKYG
jgi:hypothetical protein